MAGAPVALTRDQMRVTCRRSRNSALAKMLWSAFAAGFRALSTILLRIHEKLARPRICLLIVYCAVDVAFDRAGVLWTVYGPDRARLGGPLSPLST